MTKQLSTAAQAAKMIRVELKKVFPTVKFSVTSQYYAGGNSIDVRWDNGPTTKQVEEISGQYQYGQFNGLNDSYEHTNRRTDIPQVQYVMEQRRVTENIVNEAFEHIRYSWKCLEGKTLDDSSDEINKQLGCWTARNFLYRQLMQIDLTNGLTREKLEDVIFMRGAA